VNIEDPVFLQDQFLFNILKTKIIHPVSPFPGDVQVISLVRHVNTTGRAEKDGLTNVNQGDAGKMNLSRKKKPFRGDL
jgi:hypothetical protein